MDRDNEIHQMALDVQKAAARKLTPGVANKANIAANELMRGQERIKELEEAVKRAKTICEGRWPKEVIYFEQALKRE